MSWIKMFGLMVALEIDYARIREVDDGIGHITKLHP